MENILVFCGAYNGGNTIGDASSSSTGQQQTWGIKDPATRSSWEGCKTVARLDLQNHSFDARQCCYQFIGKLFFAFATVLQGCPCNIVAKRCKGKTVMPSPQRLILNKGHGMSSIQRTSGQRRLEHAVFSTKLIVRAHASSLPHTPAGIQHRYPTCPKLNGLTFVKAHHFRYPVVLRKGMKQTSISFHDAAWFSGISTTGYYTLYIEGSE